MLLKYFDEHYNFVFYPTARRRVMFFQVGVNSISGNYCFYLCTKNVVKKVFCKIYLIVSFGIEYHDIFGAV